MFPPKLPAVSSWVFIAGISSPTMPILEAAVVEPLRLPNSGRVPIGSLAAVEGGAVVARIQGGASSWYNPAGLVYSHRPSISGNASLYELATSTYSTPSGTEKRRSVNVIPASVASVGWLKKQEETPLLAWGFGIYQPIAWKSSVENENDLPEYDYYQSNRASYELSAITPTLALGYRLNDTMAVGMCLHVSYIEGQTEDVAEEYAGRRRSSLSYAFQESWYQVQSRLSAGWQWHPDEVVSVGARVRTPELALASSETARVRQQLTDYVDDTGTADRFVLSGRIDDADAEFKQPWEVALGVAFKPGRWSFECDVTYRSKIDRYLTVTPDLVAEIRVDQADGTTITDTQTYEGARTADREVWDVAVGVGYEVNEQWSVHGGGFTARSSVKDSEAYTDLDLYGITAGVMRRGENSSLTLGLYYTFSNDDKEDLFDPVEGWTTSKVSMTSLGLTLGSEFYF